MGSCWQDNRVDLVFGFCSGVGCLVPSLAEGLVDWQTQAAVSYPHQMAEEAACPTLPHSPSSRDSQSCVSGTDPSKVRAQLRDDQSSNQSVSCEDSLPLLGACPPSSYIAGFSPSSIYQLKPQVPSGHPVSDSPLTLPALLLVWFPRMLPSEIFILLLVY